MSLIIFDIPGPFGFSLGRPGPRRTLFVLSAFNERFD